jgi:hypothetical protein
MEPTMMVRILAGTLFIIVLGLLVQRRRTRAK